MKHFINKSIIFTILGVVFIGCTSGNVALTPENVTITEFSKGYTSFTLENNKQEDMAPLEQRTVFQKELQQRLLSSGLKEGKDLKIIYKFTSFSEGSRVLRHFVGFVGAGKGEVVVHVSFYDTKTNKLIGETSTKGDISMGAVYGGSIDEAIIGIAKMVHLFIKVNYL